MVHARGVEVIPSLRPHPRPTRVPLSVGPTRCPEWGGRRGNRSGKPASQAEIRAEQQDPFLGIVNPEL